MGAILGRMPVMVKNMRLYLAFGLIFAFNDIVVSEWNDK